MTYLEFSLILLISTEIRGFDNTTYKGLLNGIRIPKAGEKYDFEFVYNLTKYLHEEHHFHSFVTFSRHHQRFRPKSLVVRLLEQALVEDFHVPIIVWGMDLTAKLRNNIGLNNLVFVQINNITDPILNVVDYTLEGLHIISILFFYKDKDNKEPSFKELMQFFKWCWSKNMVNIVLTFQTFSKSIDGKLQTQNQVFTYSPFPTVTIYNLTERVRNGDVRLLIGHIKNVKGYKFKTPIFPQPPYVFLNKQDRYCYISKRCMPEISGTAGRLYTEYIKSINGTIDIVRYRNISYKYIVDIIFLGPAKKEIDIGTHPFSDLVYNTMQTEGSYPILQTNVCIIVPLRWEIPYEQYLHRSFHPIIWFLVFMTFIALFSLEIFKNQKVSPDRSGVTIAGNALLYAISMLIDQSYAISYQKKLGIYKVLYLIILIMTFILTNIYIASLTSLLNLTPSDNQIDTTEEFLDSGLEILVSSIDRELYFKTNRLNEKLIPRLRVTSMDVLIKARESLNTKYAYLATTDYWTMLNYQQKHLQKPLFRIPGKELCTAKYHLKLPTQFDSPFQRSLSLFFMATQESGIALKWQDMSIYHAMQLNWLKRVNKTDQPWKPLTLQHFIYANRFVGGFMILALICFISELLWFNLKKIKKKDIRKKW